MDKKYLIPTLFLTTFVAGALIILNEYTHTQTSVPLVPPEAEVVATYTDMTDSDNGLVFSYLSDTRGYLLETERMDTSVASGLLVKYTLINKVEAAALASSDIPTEGPPTIDIRVYKNNQDLPLMDWIEAQAVETNIEFAFEPATSTTLFGLPAVTYQIDGLYAARVYVVEKEGLIFMFTGWFGGESDAIVADFNTLLDSVRFIERTPTIVVPDPVVVEAPGLNTFVGTLEEVNVGCFVDGECFVRVDGVKVTVIRGWSSDTVGSVQGVDGFGELEAFIGEEVEVYAREVGDGTLSLYGDEAYYVKLVDTAGVVASLQSTASALGVSITPTAVLEDSRCPFDVTCVWAGTVRLSATLVSGSGKVTQEFSLGVPVITQTEEITLMRVDPATNSQVSIEDSEYRFLFKVSKR